MNYYSLNYPTVYKACNSHNRLSTEVKVDLNSVVSSFRAIFCLLCFSNNCKSKASFSLEREVEKKAVNIEAATTKLKCST